MTIPQSLKTAENYLELCLGNGHTSAIRRAIELFEQYINLYCRTL